MVKLINTKIREESISVPLKIRNGEDRETIKIMKSFPGFKEVDEVCRKYGYGVRYLVKNKEGNFSIMIYVNDHSRYKDPISMDMDEYSSRYYPEGFKAQTGAYGSLSVNEYEKYLEAAKDTYDLLKYLNSVDFSSLDIYEI